MEHQQFSDLGTSCPGRQLTNNWAQVSFDRNACSAAVFLWCWSLVQCSEACFYTARSCFSVAGIQHAWMVSAWFWYMCCDQMFPHCVLFFAVIAIIEVEGQKFWMAQSRMTFMHRRVNYVWDLTLWSTLGRECLESVRALCIGAVSPLSSCSCQS